MSSLITRGFYKYDRIITRGYGQGWLGRMKTEILKFVSKFTQIITKESNFTEGCD